MNYSFNSRVRYSETGENGKLTLPGGLNYFQDCCTFHAESVGLGGDVLKARDRAWVLSSWQVIVDEYPAMGTEIRITTAPYDFKGFMGMRNFTIETMDGKKLAWANSNWTSVHQYRDSGEIDTCRYRQLHTRRKAGNGLCTEENQTSG